MDVKELNENFEEQVKKDGEHLRVFANYAMENLVNTPENIEKLSKKPLKDAYENIKSQARKVAKNGMACIQDNEVFGWFREFYEISDLTVATKAKQPEDSLPSSIFDLM